MKIAGLIGGLSPESTIDYYRRIVDSFESPPPMIINSVDLKRVVDLITNDRRGAAEYLVQEIEKLADAGADFGAITANTPHVVFDQIRSRVRLPLISIVEATLSAARAAGLKRLGIFGTRFTMSERLYPDALAPTPDEQTVMHEMYMGELVKGKFLPETRDQFLAIVDTMIARHRIDGLILGGTELPLLLRDAHYERIPFLDTTKIHVKAIVEAMR